MVVTGAAAAEVRPALAEEPVQLVENAEWQSGQASSVQVGLAAVRGEAEAVVFLLADMPFVDAPLVRALVAEHRRSFGPDRRPAAWPTAGRTPSCLTGWPIRTWPNWRGTRVAECFSIVSASKESSGTLRFSSMLTLPRTCADCWRRLDAFPGPQPGLEESLGPRKSWGPNRGRGRHAVAAIVLAAGESRRMGRPKMTLSWPGGGTVIGQVARTFLGAGCEPVVVVTGGDRGAVEAALEGIPVHLVQNPRYAEGEMLSSIQAGLRSLLPGVEAVLISPGDLPLLRMETIRRLVEAWERSGSPLVAPSFEGRRGHPVLVARSRWPALLALAEGQTLRDFLRAPNTAIEHVTVDDPGIRTDLDTPDEYRRAKDSL